MSSDTNSTAPLTRLSRAARRLLVAPVTLIAVGACSDMPTDPLDSVTPSLRRARSIKTTPFSDQFDAFDASRWSKQEHALGRGYFRAANVHASDGSLQLVLPRATYDGGEIRALDLVGYGRFAVRMRTPHAPGSISAFFLYQGRYRSDEIDIEIMNDGSGKVLFTTWAKGRQTHTVTQDLGFDPGAAFHNYEIEWTSSSVRFMVDGNVLQEWSSKKLPGGAMYLMASAWWPTWLSGPKPGADVALEIDRIDVTTD